MLPIAEKIRTLRRSRNLTQESLADALGVTSQSVSRWEKGQTYPDIELVPRIAAYFGVTTDELLVSDEETKTREIMILYSQCRQKCDSEENPKKRHDIRMKTLSKMPTDNIHTYHIAADICRDLVYCDVLSREEALPLLRELCGRLLNQNLDQCFRNWALRYIYMYEDEDRLSDWSKYAAMFYTQPELLELRYLHRGEFARHNKQQQKNLYTTLFQTFPCNAVQRFQDKSLTNESGIFAAEFTLQLIDLFRDPEDGTDLFLRDRAWCYLFLAKYRFRAGDREGGYEALEKSLSLCRILFTNPADLICTCSHPFFNLLAVSGRKSILNDTEDPLYTQMVYGVFYQGFHGMETQWKAFRPYIEEERYRNILKEFDALNPAPEASQERKNSHSR